MNIMAVYSSESDPKAEEPFYELLFLASHSQISCYNALQLKDRLKPFKVLNHAGDAMINQLRALPIAGIPCLVAVCHDHHVYIYFIEDLDRKPIVLQNDESTWGLSASPVSPDLYVSANSFNISHFNLNAQVINDNAPKLQGHKHNIPCIDVSPCGRFLASVSIDKTVRTWHLPSCTLLGTVALPTWGWMCKWIDRKSAVLHHPRSFLSFRTPTSPKPVASAAAADLPTFVAKESTDRARAVQTATEEMLSSDDDAPDEEVDLEVDDEVDDLNDMEDGFDGHAQVEVDASSAPKVVPRLTQRLDEALAQAPFLHGHPPHSASQTAAIPQGEAQVIAEADMLAALKETDYLLVTGTFNHLCLFDSQLHCIAQLGDIMAAQEKLKAFANVSRLSMVEAIPELGLIIAGSQGHGGAALLTLFYNVLTTRYEIKPWKRLPDTADFGPLSGLSVTKRAPGSSLNATGKTVYTLYLFFHSHQLLVYDLAPL